MSATNDLISRQAAIDAVKRLHDVAWANWKETRISANAMIDELKDLPSAQPETMYYPQVDGVTPSVIAQPERKKGKWIKGGEQPYFRKHFDIVVCSVCNKRGEQRWNYCPNCGADMRK